MPTTRFKNAVYRAALPLKAPRLPRRPSFSAEGHSLHSRSRVIHLLRRHHVLGSAGLVTSGEDQVLMLSSSDNPPHRAQRTTLFRVASITKMATALSVLSLSEKGLLDPDRGLNHFFPEERLPEAAEEITARRLLSHTGGLTDPSGLEAHLLAGDPFPGFLEECMTSVPGTEFHYSNLGFGLLGCMMEAVTGRPVSEVVREEVFAPLHMRATLDASTLKAEDIMPVSRVLPYRAGKDVRITRLGEIPLTEADPLRHYGHSAGSMYTDIDSLQKMLLCLRSGGRPLLSPEAGREMTRAHASYGRRSPTLSYGLGLLIIQDPTLSPSRILGHQGYAYGCADGAFWDEKTGDMLIFLNGGCSEARRGMLGRCNYDLLKLFWRKELPEWHRQK